MKNFLFAAAILLTACAPQHTIEARIDGLDGDVIVGHWDLTAGSTSDDGVRVDTIRTEAGRMVYDIAADVPVQVQMFSRSQVDRSLRGRFMPQAASINLVLQPGERVRIRGSQTEKYLDYSVRGSAGNELWARQAEALRPLSIAADSVDLELDRVVAEQNGRAQDFLPARSEILRQIDARKHEFIVSHPTEWLSAVYALEGQLDSLGVYLERLSPEVRNGFLKPRLDARYSDFEEYSAFLDNQKRVIEGVVAPEFTLNDRDGRAVSLADITAEWVVLDFWGSWCGPCIEGFPAMKRSYEKLRGRVEFVGLACSDRREDWLAALDKHTPGWTQLIDDDETKIAVKYGVGIYPTKIVLDRDRRIAKIFRGEGEDFYNYIDEL